LLTSPAGQLLGKGEDLQTSITSSGEALFDVRTGRLDHITETLEVVVSLPKAAGQKRVEHLEIQHMPMAR